LERSLIDLELDHIRRMSALLRHYKLLLVVEGVEDGLQAGGDFDLQCQLFGPEASADDDDNGPSVIKSEMPYGMYEEDMGGDYFDDGGAWNSAAHFGGGRSNNARPGTGSSSSAVHSLPPPPMAGLKRKKSYAPDALESSTHKKRKRKSKTKTPKVKLIRPGESGGNGAVSSFDVGSSHAVENGEEEDERMRKQREESRREKGGGESQPSFSRDEVEEEEDEEGDDLSQQDSSLVGISPIALPSHSENPSSSSRDFSNDAVADNSNSSLRSRAKTQTNLNVSAHILDDCDDEPP